MSSSFREFAQVQKKEKGLLLGLVVIVTSEKYSIADKNKVENVVLGLQSKGQFSKQVTICSVMGDDLKSALRVCGGENKDIWLIYVSSNAPFYASSIAEAVALTDISATTSSSTSASSSSREDLLVVVNHAYCSSSNHAAACTLRRS